MNKDSKIYVAGHRGLVGSAIVRCLKERGYTNIVTRTHGELDLQRQADVEAFFDEQQPEYVFLAAAYVGGIGANSAYKAHFIYRNLAIGMNVIEASRKSGVKKLLNLGSTCIYPRLAKQPIKEESLLTGALEPTNDAYALAKISILKLCASYNAQYGTDYLSLMPTNLYGKGDNYDLEGSHVLPAMIRKFHEAKVSHSRKVTLWGDGSPLREFLCSDDLADCAVWLMETKHASDLRNTAGDFVNVGSGVEVSIRELAQTVCRIVFEDTPGTQCTIEWDTSKPGGTPRKLCDTSRLEALGWRAKTSLEEGIRLAYADYLSGGGRK